MTRYIWDREVRHFRDAQTGALMDIPERSEITAPRIQSDIKPYMSPLGTGLIDGRKARQEDLKRGGCREVDPSEFKPSEAFLEKRERHKREARN